MTEQEAIKVFNTIKAFGKCRLVGDEQEELFEVVYKALKMQIRMKPINTGTSWEEYWECPICHKPATDYYGCKKKYCSECGQKIDWRKEE